MHAFFSRHTHNVSVVLAVCSHRQLIETLNCIFHYSSTSSFFCYIKLHNILLAFSFADVHFVQDMCISSSHNKIIPAINSSVMTAF